MPHHYVQALPLMHHSGTGFTGDAVNLLALPLPAVKRL